LADDRKQGQEQTQAPAPAAGQKYGLISTRATDGPAEAQPKPSLGYLGPQPELLARKLEEQQRSEAAARQLARAHSSKRAGGGGGADALTAEEREERVRAMQSDAERSEALRQQRQGLATSAAEAASAAPRAAVGPGAEGQGPQFLASMRQEVYLADESLEGRISANKSFVLRADGQGEGNSFKKL